MIIDDLDPFRRARAPDEADPPLTVDPDTMLTLPVAAQSLKPVSRHGGHVLQRFRLVQHPQLPASSRRNVAESAALLAVKKHLGLPAAKGSYHTDSISWRPLNGEP